MLRGLLTATTATTYTVHGQALLLAVRTCYNIYLMSRSEVNQTTAKATLTQVGAKAALVSNTAWLGGKVPPWVGRLRHVEGWSLWRAGVAKHLVLNGLPFLACLCRCSTWCSSAWRRTAWL